LLAIVWIYVLLCIFCVDPSRDGSVGIVTSYGVDCWGSIPGKSKISVLHSLQTCYEDQPVSYMMLTEGDKCMKLTTYLQTFRGQNDGAVPELLNTPLSHGAQSFKSSNNIGLLAKLLNVLPVCQLEPNYRQSTSIPVQHSIELPTVPLHLDQSGPGGYCALCKNRSSLPRRSSYAARLYFSCCGVERFVCTDKWEASNSFCKWELCPYFKVQ
jgi:hypothetical protein